MSDLLDTTPTARAGQNSAKVYRVWTHYELASIEVSAASKRDAVAIALAYRAANPPVIPGREETAWYCDADERSVETHVWPDRFAKALPTPQACIKPVRGA